MIRFILIAFAVQIVLLAVYKLWLERDKMHKFNRFYLIFGLLLSVILPFLKFEIVTETIYVQSSPMPVDIPMFESTIPTPEPVDFTGIFLWSVYAIGVSVFAFRFGRNLVRMRSMARNNPSEKIGNNTLVLLTDSVSPHSFFGHIFLSADDFKKGKLPDEVLEHERAHIGQWHSADVLLIEIFRTVFWFNPMLATYRDAIRLNHEFLADEAVVSRGASTENYQQILLRFATRPVFYPASSLNFHITKKRFQMMTTTHSRMRSGLKILALGLAIPAAIAAISVKTVAQEVAMADSEDAEASKTVFNQPEQGESIETRATEAIVKTEFTQRGGQRSVALSEISQEPKSSEKEFAKYYKYTEFSLIAPDGTITKKKYSQLSKSQKNALPDPKTREGYNDKYMSLRIGRDGNPDNSEVLYSLAGIKTKPEFQGGISRFYEWFAAEFKYTKEATDAKIKGRIFLSFTVENDGKITGVKLLRGMGYGLDEEAIRVMEACPDWTPAIENGKAVPATYQLPIMVNAQ